MAQKKQGEAKKSATADVAAKRQKFVNLAENRTKNAIKAIRTVAKLGNQNAYEFDESDVKKIAAALLREVEALRARMSVSGNKESVEFEL